MSRNNLMIFALETDSDLVRTLSEKLGLDMSPHELRIFEDGEHKIRPLQSVQGKDVYVLGSALSRQGSSVHDELCRLLFFMGGLRDAGAARLTLLMPYLCYSRKDRKTKLYDPTTTQYVARLFETMGVDLVVTIDVHNISAFQNAFRVPTEHLEAADFLARELKGKLDENHVAIFSPDLGGIKRAQIFREVLFQKVGIRASFALLYKERSHGIVTTGDVIGSVDGHDVVIVDDMIATGTTMLKAAEACLRRGAKRVFLLATHALFTGDARHTLLDSSIHRIIVSNTVSHRDLDSALQVKLSVVDVSSLLAQVVVERHANFCRAH
jgi:ribose-phosphate pyrophosphokinase